MERRLFVAGTLGVLASVPAAGWAQTPGLPTIGFLNSATPELYTFNVAAFHQGLLEQGFAEGRNVLIEYRWARGKYESMPALAAQLVDRGVAVIAATGDVVSARAAQAASRQIPIVFTIGGDPTRFGLVQSYSRPGGNITGISFGPTSVGGKRIELLHELAPTARIALVMNPDNPNVTTELRDAEQAARALGHETVVFNASSGQALKQLFDDIVRAQARALFVATDPMLLSQREPIARFALAQRMPAISFVREFAVAGGLMSYGASIRNMYREAGNYVGRILKGAKPQDMPVLQPTLVEFVINQKTAKALGLAIPQAMLLRADEVIQ